MMLHFRSIQLFLTFLISLSLRSESRGPTAGHPVVLIPGDGGAQLWANLTGKPTTPHYLCDKQTKEDFLLWLNLELFPPYVIDCFVDNIRLVYNATTRKTSNPPGVDVKIKGWGNTSTVEWLDTRQWGTGHYFSSIVEASITWGYARGKTIRGAPFDFRKAPNEFGELYGKLKALIEDTYRNAGNKKVVTVGHSMGNPVTWHFFTTMTQAWKDKFIKSHVSLSGPYAGSTKIVLLYASGYNFNHWRIVLPPLTARTMQRTLPSSTFLIPSPHYWNETEVLAETPDRNYTTANYHQFFTDIKYPTGWEMYKDTANITWNLGPPGVEMHCVHGQGVPTPLRFKYSKGQFPDTQPTIVYGDGDSSVNMRSLLACLKFKDQQKQAVHQLVVPGNEGEHINILQSTKVIQYIQKVLYDKI